MNLSQNKSTSLFLAVLAVTVQSCSAQETPLPGKEAAPGVRIIGRITHPRLTESSGVVASRQFPGVLWAHTDGGGPRKQNLFAITREGRSLGEFYVTDVLLADWEDIAIDDQKHLFIADTRSEERRVGKECA